MSLYDDLGVEKGADAETIKKAYKKRAHKTHPDKEGGDENEFKKVQKAYEILSSPERRKSYDEGGDGKQADDPYNLMLREVAALILMILEHIDVDSTNLIDEAINHVKGGKVKYEASIKAHQQKIKRFEAAIKRVKRKGKKGDNLITSMIEAQVGMHKRAIETAETTIKQGDAMIEFLKDYEYSVDAGTGGSRFTNLGFGFFVQQ